MKKAIRIIHQWLGIISGLLVFIIALTGAIYAFQEEISDYTEDFRFVKVEEKPYLEPSQLEVIAKNELPDKVLHSLEYSEEGKAAIAIFYHDDPLYYYKMYLNPYDGEVLHTKNMDDGFFQWILKGHMYLWLPHEIGTVVVLTATLVFLLMLISGFLLWLPKKVKGLKQRLSFQWKKTTKWKRKNWDWHAIVGFYTLLFSFLFSITGLVWVLPGFAVFYHQSLGGEKSMIYTDAVSVRSEEKEAIANPMDVLYQYYTKEKAQYNSLEIHPPETDSSSILVVTNPSSGTYWKSNYVFYNQYNLEELEVDHIWSKYQDANFADKVLRLNYDIHTGTALGITGKIIAFLLSLFIASLPITGLLIWYGKKRKTKKSKT